MIIFWHRRDLRITDNVGLAAARQQSSKVVGIFCLDPNILERDDIAPARVTYMIGCLQQLQQRYLQLGSQLLILHEEPTKAIPSLAVALHAKAVFWNWDVEPYSQTRDKKVREALQQKGIEIHNSWDQLLHAPGEIVTQSNKPYTIYTPFWKNWSQQPKAQPVESLKDVEGLTQQELDIAESVGTIPLPTAPDLGYRWDNELLVAPGEKAAQEALEKFCDRTITEYQQQRNFPSMDGTSQLSAALKFGTIGIRTVWNTAQTAYTLSRSDENRNSIQTWQKELAWREFYQHAMYFFPELADGPYRDLFKDFPWDNNPKLFQAWCEGKTGYPIVDAAMRQLNQTGWMHNRCRMIVASFLTKDLFINWQWGEKYFLQKLFDGDLSANNGGWQWSASSGMDPKPLRIFNPASQAQKFDPDAEYIRQWLPELGSIDTEHLVTGKIDQRDRDVCGYPAPLVDHKQRQQEFKQRYRQQKER
ncbi:MAG: deoxyribodipyrimidine photolyase [Symploca sp. SIO1B1]|nr:deoxyribodipyrimidine photolyase [Symploca sp. SIO1C2]NER45631.1 deoxyribodipyrimidine photolyase [Symploca sp. SIO1A3]NER96065.1 deoxyribodipyrimidine photolyase [Symploca sp. SIO1B1]